MEHWANVLDVNFEQVFLHWIKSRFFFQKRKNNIIVGNQD